MRRSLKFAGLLVAALALVAPAAAQAGSFTIAPGGAVTLEKDDLIITHYQLTISRYPLWVRVGTRTCDVEMVGTAGTGPIADYDQLIELTSGSTSDCTAPADVSFADGPWWLNSRARTWEPITAWIENPQISMDVGGTTCHCPAGGRSLIGDLTLTPALHGGSLVNTFDTSWYSSVSTMYLEAVPRSAACGAVRLDSGIQPPWLIGPGQTITQIP